MSSLQDDRQKPEVSQTPSNGPERIDVDDLDLFEGVADENDNCDDDRWYDCSSRSYLRLGPGIAAASEGGS